MPLLVGFIMVLLQEMVGYPRNFKQKIEKFSLRKLLEGQEEEITL